MNTSQSKTFRNITTTSTRIDVAKAPTNTLSALFYDHNTLLRALKTRRLYIDVQTINTATKARMLLTTVGVLRD